MVNLSSLLSRHYFVEYPSPFNYFKEYQELWQQEPAFSHYQCRNCRSDFVSYSRLRKHITRNRCANSLRHNSKVVAKLSAPLKAEPNHYDNVFLSASCPDENANYLSFVDDLLEKFVLGKSENCTRTPWTLLYDDSIRKHPQLRARAIVKLVRLEAQIAQFNWKSVKLTRQFLTGRIYKFKKRSKESERKCSVEGSLEKQELNVCVDSNTQRDLCDCPGKKLQSVIEVDVSHIESEILEMFGQTSPFLDEEFDFTEKQSKSNDNPDDVMDESGERDQSEIGNVNQNFDILSTLTFNCQLCAVGFSNHLTYQMHRYQLHT